MKVDSLSTLRMWIKGRKSVRASDVPCEDTRLPSWLHKLWLARTLTTRWWDREAGEYVYRLE